MAIRVVGGATSELHYEFRGRSADMVLRGTTDGVPDAAALGRLGAAVSRWERDGNGFVGSYRSRRSVDSTFLGQSLYSIDGLTDAALSLPEVSPGLISADDEEMIGTSIAPLVHWHVDPAGGRPRRGRTYAVGLTRAETDAHDEMRLTSSARFDLGRVFQSLIELVSDTGEWQLVKLLYSPADHVGGYHTALPIVQASMDALLCGTQRRRSRPRGVAVQV